MFGFAPEIDNLGENVIPEALIGTYYHGTERESSRKILLGACIDLVNTLNLKRGSPIKNKDYLILIAEIGVSCGRAQDGQDFMESFQEHLITAGLLESPK